jgi:pyruvate/2-oxoglutarate/acetoin dehydrogenase E1 component
LTVVAPSSPYDAKGLLIASIREDNPVVFLENKALYASKGPVPEEPYALPLYQSKVKREGKDVTLVATMKMVEYALNVASEMLDDGVSIEVIDPMTLSPVDMHPVIESVKKTGRLVVVYDGPMSWGWGSEIVARVSEKCLSYLKAAPVRVAGLDVPIPAAPNLEDFVVPNEMDIRQGIISVLSE